MTSTTILTILLVFSFIVGRFLRRFETPNFVFSGMIYLLFGLLVGSHWGLGFLSSELLSKLEPLISLLTGIAGCLLGLRVKKLFQNRKILFTGMLSAILVFTVVATGFFILAFYFLPVSAGAEQKLWRLFIWEFNTDFDLGILWYAFGVAATACSASLMNLGSASRFKKESTEITKVLSLLTPSVQMVAIILLGVCLASARATMSASQLQITVAEWLMASIFSGILCGLLFSLFIGHQSNQDRVLLAGLGAVIFACGVGSILGISSLFVSFTTGATISLVSSYHQILKDNLIKIEEPVFVLLLIMGGASWKPELELIWILPAAYFGIRFVMFSFFPQIIYRSLTKRTLSRLGQGLLGQDLMAVAIAMSFAQQFPKLEQMFMTTILGAIFLNDFLANTLLKKVILDNELSTQIRPIEAKEGSQ
ncbi:MAG: hypothetical protein KDD33_12840 [Bdellovibrionales bacterium]|nr:hypothetical protein [Bdellovibrionales bacterium]